MTTGQLHLDFYHPSGTQRIWSDPLNESDYQYVQVPDNDYVDGVFVPISPTNEICVSSQRHMFIQDTLAFNKRFGVGIGYWHKPPYPKHGSNPVLNGKVYASLTHPSIMMRRNKGITFDLYAIRKDLAGARIVCFTALCGISMTCQSNRNPIESIYVLIDGKAAASHTELTPVSGGKTVSVELKDTDRFLTLVTAFKVIGSPRNHVIFAEPALKLAPVTTPSQNEQAGRGGSEVEVVQNL